MMCIVSCSHGMQQTPETMVNVAWPMQVPLARCYWAIAIDSKSQIWLVVPGFLDLEQSLSRERVWWICVQWVVTLHTCARGKAIGFVCRNFEFWHCVIAECSLIFRLLPVFQCFSVQHWKAGRSLGMRLQWMNGTQIIYYYEATVNV